MNVPPIVKIALLTVGLTGVYTLVGQSVPQKEVHPPEVIELPDDLSTQDLVEIGRQIFEGKGICNTCHTIGKSGALRYPDMQGLATRAASRRPGMSALQYMTQSLYEPEAFIVEGFAGGMPVINKPPIGLTDDEIRAVLAYLQTLGGEATVTMETSLDYTQPMGEVVAAAAESEPGEGSAEDAEETVEAEE